MLYGTVPTSPSLSAGESVVDTLRRVVVVPYSEFGKTTPNSSSASSTTPRESIRFRFRSDPDRLLDALFLFWKAAEHSKPGSRGQIIKHAIILLLVSSQNLDHLVVGGCESYISNPFCHSGGAKRNKNPPLLIGSSYVFLLIKRSVGRDMDNWISWLGYPYVHE